jgi:hypothetical protein
MDLYIFCHGIYLKSVMSLHVFGRKRYCRERKPFRRNTCSVSGFAPRKMGHLKFCQGVSLMYQETEFENLEASDLQSVGYVGHGLG